MSSLLCEDWGRRKDLNRKEAESVVVLVLCGMNELHSLMGLAELGPPHHNPAVKIDILLDVPPSSSVSCVSSRMHNPEGVGMRFSERSGSN